MLNEWAIKWGVSAHALHDLKQRAGMVDAAPPGDVRGVSEAAVSNRLRVAASEAGGRLWRNQVGALPNEAGVPIRFGLANDSSQLNKVVKSADLIGIYPLTIEPHHVGTTVGQFWSVEAKEVGWHYTGRGREAAQFAWVNLVLSLGGRAGFST